MTKFINANGSIIDTANLAADWVSCFFTPVIRGSDSANQTPPAPQPISVTGAKSSSGDPSSDGNRKIVGVVTGVVFGN